MNCFVIMPFSIENSSSIYEKWIKTAVEECYVNEKKLTCDRGDKILRPGEIITHILEYLVVADIVIADLTSQNPNVFYELGVRHALRNNTILITQKVKDVPFDLQTQRIIQYNYTPDGMLELKESLKAFINEILSNAELIDNPVRKYLYERDIAGTVSSATTLGQNAVEILSNKMTGLDSSFTEQFSQLSRIIEGLTTELAQNINQKNLNNKLPSEGYMAKYPSHIKKYIGAWYDAVSQSSYYVKEIKGEIRICYCFGGNNGLTGQCINLKFYNDILVANFVWLNNSVLGQLFFELKGYDILSGGWWCTIDLELENAQPEAIRNLPERSMRKIMLVRKKIDYDEYPIWAKNYFANLITP